MSCYKKQAIRLIFAIFIVFCVGPSSRAYCAEKSNQGWSSWFSGKVHQYKKAAQAWSPDCQLFKAGLVQEAAKKPGAFSHALDTKLGGKHELAWSLAVDLAGSLACLAGTAAGSAAGITVEVVKDSAYKISQVLERLKVGEITKEQAEREIETALPTK